MVLYRVGAIFPIAVAFGLITVDKAAVHAPMRVVALTGIIFVIGGCMILAGQRSRLSNLFAAVMCLSFASLGSWVSLFAPSKDFSGGIPLLSNETNAEIAPWAFGCGALISLGLAGYGLHQLFKPSPHESMQWDQSRPRRASRRQVQNYNERL